MTDVARPKHARPRGPSLWVRWRHALATTNPLEDAELDPVSRWLVVSRAAVLPMTIVAGLVAGLLAIGHDASFGLWFLSFAGIVLAHVSNNLMNDLFDTEVGLDTERYPRALYAPHPVLAGLTTRRELIGAAMAVNVVDLLIGLYLFSRRGWPILFFAVAGFVLSVAYTAPPLRLKKRGLGEPDVLVVWGPLMVGGTYYAATGSMPWEVLLASIPYGLLCTAVLMGKHVDKRVWDEAEGVRTLPVILGDAKARRWTQYLVLGFYPAVLVSVLAGALPWPALVVFVAVPVAAKASRTLAQPRPAEPPAGFPVWPLWYAAFAFLHTRRAGALLVAGLVIAAITGQQPYGF